jgi:hypothetical protein
LPLAEYFGHECVLPLLLPLVFERLKGGSVWEREASILAIGAVSSCIRGLESHMPQLYPYMLQVSTTPHHFITKNLVTGRLT